MAKSNPLCTPTTGAIGISEIFSQRFQANKRLNYVRILIKLRTI